MGGISIWQLLIVFGIVVLVFGTRKLRNMGGDIGGAIRNFKQAMNTEDSNRESEEEDQEAPLERKDKEEAPSTSAETERKHDHS